MSLVRETRLSHHGKERPSHVQGAMKRQLGVLEGRSRSEKWSETVWEENLGQGLCSHSVTYWVRLAWEALCYTWGAETKHLALDFCWCQGALCWGETYLSRGRSLKMVFLDGWPGIYFLWPKIRVSLLSPSGWGLECRQSCWPAHGVAPSCSGGCPLEWRRRERLVAGMPPSPWGEARACPRPCAFVGTFSSNWVRAVLGLRTWDFSEVGTRKAVHAGLRRSPRI